MSRGDETLQIEVGEQRIAGTIVRPDTSVPGILFVHGWGGHREQYLARAREIATLGCISLTIDLRGHGHAQGDRESVTREDNLRDVLAAYDVLVGMRGIDQDAIAIIGSSYGAYLAAIATMERRVRWLGLRVPALYEDADWDVPKAQLDKKRLRAYRNEVHAFDDNRALAACARYEGDVLLVESEQDDIVPHATIQSYQLACTKARSLTYRRIEGADHGLTSKEAQQSYTAVLTDWIREMVFGARKA